MLLGVERKFVALVFCEKVYFSLFLLLLNGFGLAKSAKKETNQIEVYGFSLSHPRVRFLVQSVILLFLRVHGVRSTTFETYSIILASYRPF